MAETIFVGVPSHDGRIDADSAVMGMTLASKRFNVHRECRRCSLLSLNFNSLLCAARKKGVRWFAMLHGDVIPEPYWVDTLIDEAEANAAQLVSAVVPIKDSRGLTSTAIDDPENPWIVYARLTQAQVNHPDFPATFDAKAAREALAKLPDELRIVIPDNYALLANTGCMVIDLGWEWASELYFENRDFIIQTTEGPQPVCQPEDWLFSRQVAYFGGKVIVTRKVKTAHVGAEVYQSDQVWGQSRDTLQEAKGAIHV